MGLLGSTFGMTAHHTARGKTRTHVRKPLGTASHTSGGGNPARNPARRLEWSTSRCNAAHNSAEGGQAPADPVDLLPETDYPIRAC
mmetsp:Transcript_3101/g.6953  ORF Transcript_3101/g.6953 Transcript_3101/m.6953 type:complete len:86 (+) Transcript_3101:1096-1353(+)